VTIVRGMMRHGWILLRRLNRELREYPQGLKPNFAERLMSELKLRPPKVHSFSAVARIPLGTRPTTAPVGLRGASC
jgi:hypothetical protein